MRKFCQNYNREIFGYIYLVVEFKSSYQYSFHLFKKIYKIICKLLYMFDKIENLMPFSAAKIIILIYFFHVLFFKRPRDVIIVRPHVDRSEE